MEPAGDIDAAALVHVLCTDLGQRAPCYAATPLGGFLHLAGCILPARTGGHAKRSAGGAGGGVLHLRIVSQVADELHAIEVVHGGSSVRSPSRNGKAAMLSARSHRAKPGVNGGKGTGGGAGRVHWSAAQTLAPEPCMPCGAT